jgi:hypothetical protein
MSQLPTQLRIWIELMSSDSKGQEHAHHLVAQAARAAAPARKVLKEVGIGIHDAANGAAVKTGTHAGTHTATYYGRVNEIITNAKAGGKAAVNEALREIGGWFK